MYFPQINPITSNKQWKHIACWHLALKLQILFCFFILFLSKYITSVTFYYIHNYWLDTNKHTERERFETIKWLINYADHQMFFFCFCVCMEYFNTILDDLHNYAQNRKVARRLLASFFSFANQILAICFKWFDHYQ